jgi:hypothetical protein
MNKTKTISARVPLDIAEMVENACKHKGVNKSQLITSLITQAPNKPNMAQGGVVAKTMNVDSMPEEVRHLLSAGGGLGVGLLVHNVLDEYLPTDKFDNEQIRKDIILLAAIAVGMGAMFGLSKLLK